MATGGTLGGGSSAAGDSDMSESNRVRGTTVTTTGAASGDRQMNARGEALVNFGLPERAEICRLGQTWHYSIPTGSAFTTVVPWPTTRSELNLTNMNAAGGLSIIIDSVWCATIVTETAASPLTIIGQISPTGLVANAAVADNTAVLARCLNGKAGAANRATGVAATIASTAYGIASQWHVLPQAPNLGGGAVSVGQATVANVNGLYIVQPGATFAMNVVVGTAVAAAGIMGVVFHLAQLDLGA